MRFIESGHQSLFNYFKVYSLNQKRGSATKAIHLFQKILERWTTIFWKQAHTFHWQYPPIHQYLKKYKLSGNEIWSINRIWHEKHFSWKTISKMWWRNYSHTLSLKIKIEHISGSIASVFCNLFLLYAMLRTTAVYWN